MDLIEAVEARFASVPDIVVTHKNWQVPTGKHFTTFYLNRRGTVFQFVAPYPTTDEKQIEQHISRILKEIR